MVRIASIVAAAAAAVLGAGLAPAAPPRPRLIVAISIDQYSAILQDRYRAGYRHGLKRLSRGITFTGYQSHSGTETCPGHSTILTGMHPAGTGIIANQWYDRASGKSVYCAAIPGAPDVRGGQNLKVDTFGDWVKAAVPGARSFAISGKDRAAIMMGGHHADGIWWWKDGVGFTTTAEAGPATPETAAPAEAFDRATFARWRAAAPVLWPDPKGACVAQQRPHRFGEAAMSGTVPPELSKQAQAGGEYRDSKFFQDQLHSTPLFDRLVLDFAMQTIDREHLGHGPAIDVLALSFSATDYVGHRFGSGGAEMCVQLGALDRTLGELFKKLDRLRVPYAVVLTADHGGTDAAERLVETQPAAKRIDVRPIVRELNAVLKRDFRLAANPLFTEDPAELYLIDRQAPDHARIRDAAVAWLKARPEVVAVFTADQVAAAVPPPGKPASELSFLERFHESYDPARSGDIMIVYPRYTSFGHPVKPGDYVAGHGSVWDEDRRVPMLFWWKGVRADARGEPVETVDIAPTLAAITGIKVPPVNGRCLSGVTVCPK